MSPTSDTSVPIVSALSALAPLLEQACDPAPPCAAAVGRPVPSASPHHPHVFAPVSDAGHERTPVVSALSALAPLLEQAQQRQTLTEFARWEGSTAAPSEPRAPRHTVQTAHTIGDPSLPSLDTALLLPSSSVSPIPPQHPDGDGERRGPGLTPGVLKKVLPALVGVVAHVLCAFLPLSSPKNMPAQRCAGLLILVSLLWAFEPIPSHVTSVLVPLLVSVGNMLRVPDFNSQLLVPSRFCAQHQDTIDDMSLDKPGDILDATAAARTTSTAFFDPIIFLFISGFTMAAALDKYRLSQRLALAMLSRAGERPSRVLLALLVIGFVMSMWLSNVAACVLNVSMVLPLLRRLPATSKWPKTVLLGIAYSTNIGGMTTPIASPQNVIATVALRQHAPGQEIDFSTWCMFAVPFCVISTFVTWVFLRWSFTTGLPQGLGHAAGPEFHKKFPPLGAREYAIVATIVATIVLWVCFSFDSVQSTFGDIGITALIPVVLFYGSGVLTTHEFNSMPWNVLILMGGGLSLGNAVQSSGLLDSAAASISAGLDGQSVWLKFLVFNSLAGILGNFVSSTVGGIILLPVIAKVGYACGHARMFVVGTSIMLAAAMGLPVSSFSNANSMAARDEDGHPFLGSSDFARTGFPIMVFELVLMSTAGFAFLTALGW